MRDQRVNMLMLDDEESDSYLFGIALEKAGANVWLHPERDGQGGMDYLTGRGKYKDRREYPLPDIIVMGLRLGKVSGLDILSWCRGSKECRDIPVVILTGSVEGDAKIEDAMALGADCGYLKPLSFSELTRIAQQIYKLGVEFRKPHGNSMEAPANPQC